MAVVGVSISFPITSTALASKDLKRPNVLVVVADDVGFSDLGSYGSEINTPNIDKVASRGVRFSNFHISPMCSPSRAMLLTGVDSHLAGVSSLHVATPLSHRGQPGYTGELATDVLTVATRLKSAGYQTYLSGKWNLGHSETTLPSRRGFDRTFTLDSTGADNYEKKPYLPIYDTPPWFEDGVPTELPDDFYSSEFLVDKLIEYIKAGESSQTERQPFFAYLGFQAIHLPVQAPKEFIQKYEGVYDEGWEVLRESRYLGAVSAGVFPSDAAPSTTPPQADWKLLTPIEQAFAAKNMAVNAAMLEAMDHHFGRLVAFLEDEDELENTFIVIVSDNGPEAGDPSQSLLFNWWADRIGYTRDIENLGERGSYAIIGPQFARATASPFAYYKFHGGEGGIRVPLIFAGPGIAGRGVSPSFAYVTDIVPTILELTNVEKLTPPDKHQLSGRSLVQTLNSPSTLVHPIDEVIAFETAGHKGVFKGDYKLVSVGTPEGDGKWRLFDISLDPGETTDLSQELPELVTELQSEYEEYAKRVGALEVPDSYSPTTQILINYLYDFLLEQFIFILLLCSTLIALLVYSIWLVRRKRSTLLTD